MRPSGVGRPEWFDRVKPGDVLGTPSGLRLVRAVHRHGERIWVYFAIRRCSWTRRPYTLYNSADTYLKRCDWVGRFKGKLSATDVLIEKEIHAPHAERYTSCHAVRGLP